MHMTELSAVVVSRSESQRIYEVLNGRGGEFPQ